MAYEKDPFAKCPSERPCPGQTRAGDDCPRFGQPDMLCRDYAEEYARARHEYLVAAGVPWLYRKATWDLAPDGSWMPIIEDFAKSILIHCAGPDRDGKGILMVGGMGPGKSRLLALIIGSLFEATVQRESVGPELRLSASRQAYYVFGPDLVDRIYDHIYGRDRHEGDTRPRLEDYQETPLLCVDDLDRVAEYSLPGQRNKGLGRLDALMEQRYAGGLPTVVTLNTQPEQLAKTEEMKRSVDRWQENMSWLTIDLPSQRKKRQGAKS